MYYIVEPRCHGNGGWIGSNIRVKVSSLKDALRFYPVAWDELCENSVFQIEWEAEENPYSGDILNELRICKDTKNPSYSAYIFDVNRMSWIEGDYPDGELKDKKRRR